MSTAEPDLSSGLVLCLETAIEGGSIAIFYNGHWVQGVVGSDEMSRAEGLLPWIDKLILKSGFEKSQLTALVVSTGPGSFTGIRIGLSTAMGLSAALNIQCLGTTAFEAIAISAKPDAVTAAVPMGRDLVAVQSFRGFCAESEPEIVSVLRFREIINSASVGSVLAHHSLVERQSLQGAGLIDIGCDLASLLFEAARRQNGTRELHPLFLDRRQFTKI